jgi:hypothetical protein
MLSLRFPLFFLFVLSNITTYGQTVIWKGNKNKLEIAQNLQYFENKDKLKINEVLANEKLFKNYGKNVINFGHQTKTIFLKLKLTIKATVKPSLSFNNTFFLE